MVQFMIFGLQIIADSGDYDRLTISDYDNLDNDPSIKLKRDENGSFINIMSTKKTKVNNVLNLGNCRQ